MVNAAFKAIPRLVVIHLRRLKIGKTKNFKKKRIVSLRQTPGHCMQLDL